MSIEKILSYPTDKFDFAGVLRNVLNLDPQMDLKQAHTIVADSASWNQITFQNDTSTEFHRRYYKSPRYNEMIELYHRFLREYLLPQLDSNEDEFIVQKEPSFRIHIPNNTALGKREHEAPSEERIGFHCDGDYNHPPTEVNYMLSITGQHDSNSCYVESEPGKEDYHPIQLEYGEVFRFYGNRCRHFNMKNTTGETRISFDFRVIPGSQYVESDAEAIHSGRKFTVGGYYMRMKRSS